MDQLCVIRRALPTEMAAIKSFGEAIHLQESGYSPEAYAAQIADLDYDFPLFYRCAGRDCLKFWMICIVPSHFAYYSEDLFVRSQTFVACDPATGEYLGVCCSGPSERADPKGEKTIKMHLLAVDARARRQGLGQRLIDLALEAARADGCAAMELESIKTIYAGAIRLYERNGFNFVKERVTQYYFGDRAVVGYRKELG